MAKRKRTKGGGRKSQGRFSNLTVHFSVRMPADMHARLEEAARKRRDQSLGQELLDRVGDSFYRDLDKANHPAMRALCFLIAQIGNEASSHPVFGEDGWRIDPYNFAVFQRAIAVLLAWLEPGGDPRPGERPNASPEEQGDRITAEIWYKLHHPPNDPKAEWPDELFESISDPQIRKTVQEMLVKRDYGIKDAAQDLLEAYATIMKKPGVEQTPETSEPGQSDRAQPEPNSMGILGTLGEPFGSRAREKESNT